VPNSLPQPGGLIFDLDGTLGDTVGARIAGWVTALANIGLDVSTEEIAPKIGMDGKRLAREVATARGRELGEDEQESVDKAAGAAFDELNTKPRAIPGVHDLLAFLGEAEVPWLIATSSRAEQVKASIAVLDLESEPTIVDGSRVEHAKPSPDLLLLAAEQLGVPPERCWSIGDSTWDMRASAAAGMTPVGVLAGSAVTAADLTAAGGQAVVERLDRLIDLLRAAGSGAAGPGDS
jgi:HAD superfamily hydrolase (TIGR01509 family)